MGDKEELETIARELDRHSTFDKEFPLAVRVRGLVDRYADLAKLYEELKKEGEKDGNRDRPTR